MKIDLSGQSVEDVLIRAMEHADSMKHVCVVYETKDEIDYPGGFFMQKDMTLSQVNWLLDLGKTWILGDHE